jgi:hypothetical protein
VTEGRSRDFQASSAINHLRSLGDRTSVTGSESSLRFDYSERSPISAPGPRIATPASSQTTPAAVEFALLQSWLASSSALQLSLHEIERQQQARGREVQRLLLQAHLQQRGNGDLGPVLYLQQQDGELLYSLGG